MGDGSGSIKFLDELSTVELERERFGRFAKWSTTCVLRLAGLPTLETLFIPPMTPMADVETAMRSFSQRQYTQSVLVRSDAGTERANYYVGGSSFPLERAVVEVAALIGGRAVIITTPTDRLANVVSANLLLSRPSGFDIELLGPGYDVSDLNRGGILPQLIVRVPGTSWDEYDRPHCSGVSTIRPSGVVDAQRREQRLQRLGARFLPRVLGRHDCLSVSETAAWLVKHGYQQLWNQPESLVSLRRIRWLLDAAWLAQQFYPDRHWSTLCISVSRLSLNGPWAFWDIVDGSSKFA